MAGSGASDTVAWVDRVPLLTMIACSVGYGIFPVHFYNVIRSGVDPLLARITEITPLLSQQGGGFLP